MGSVRLWKFAAVTTLADLPLSVTLLLDLYRASIGLLSAFRKRIHNLFRALRFSTHQEVAR